MPPEHENVASSPPGPQELEREQVHVLVGARGALRMRGRRRELRRVEHDQVERRGRVAQLAQRGERVRLLPLGAARIERGIEREVLSGERERTGRAVDRHDATRAARERGKREAARVAEHVQRLALRGDRAHGRAVRRADRGRSRSSGRRRRRRDSAGRPRRTPPAPAARRARGRCAAAVLRARAPPRRSARRRTRRPSRRRARRRCASRQRSAPAAESCSTTTSP